MGSFLLHRFAFYFIFFFLLLQFSGCPYGSEKEKKIRDSCFSGGYVVFVVKGCFFTDKNREFGFDRLQLAATLASSF